MSELARYARLAPQPTMFPPRQNADGLVKLMMLVAQDMAQYNFTGRLLSHTEADARRVMYAILDGWTPP